MKKLLIIKISAFAIIISLILILLRHENKSFAIILSLTSGIFIFYIILPELNKVLLTLNNLSQNFNLKSDYIIILLKTIGIAYICEFTSQICSDAGEKSIASKIEFSGKILIMASAIPILNDLLEIIINII